MFSPCRLAGTRSIAGKPDFKDMTHLNNIEWFQRGGMLCHHCELPTFPAGIDWVNSAEMAKQCVFKRTKASLFDLQTNDAMADFECSLAFR